MPALNSRYTEYVFLRYMQDTVPVLNVVALQIPDVSGSLIICIKMATTWGVFGNPRWLCTRSRMIEYIPQRHFPATIVSGCSWYRSVQNTYQIPWEWLWSKKIWAPKLDVVTVVMTNLGSFSTPILTPVYLSVQLSVCLSVYPSNLSFNPLQSINRNHDQIYL